MVRTQIQLTEEQYRALRRLAAERDLSLAELVRLAVQQLLSARHQPDRRERWRRARAVVGRFRSGLDDLARRHDDHLAEAISR